MSFYHGYISSSNTLHQDVKLFSQDKQHWAVIQADGNFCVYNSRGKPTWASGTYHPATPGPYYLVTQQDGNLVVYGQAGKVIWAAASNTWNAPVSLVMQNDGNLVLYDKASKPIWTTHTGGL